jgi:hypothetical protein
MKHVENHQKRDREQSMKRYQLLSKIHVTLQESADAKNALYLQIRGNPFHVKKKFY